jgi:hypothetical protein
MIRIATLIKFHMMQVVEDKKLHYCEEQVPGFPAGPHNTCPCCWGSVCDLVNCQRRYQNMSGKVYQRTGKRNKI